MTETVITTEHNVVNPVSTDSSGDVVTDASGTSAVNIVNREKIAGETNEDSAANAYLKTYTPTNVTVVEQTSALTIGAGAAGDTHLLGLLLILNAGPATVAVTGWEDEDGDAKTITFTGSTTADVYIDWAGLGLINSKAAYTVTATVADTVLVLWRAV